jgi:hypothetical protein
MTIFSRFKKDEPSSAEDPEVSAAAPGDPEKAEAIAIENGSQSPNIPSPTRIDPELEKRVIRKLDKRLVSLVFVLCKFYASSSQTSLTTPDLLAYLDRSNIG